MPSTYGERALEQAIKSVGPDRSWRLDTTRQEDTTGDQPHNAFAVVTSKDLHLRFVADRGVHHLDIGCLDAAGSRRWVPFEVVGLAAGLWSKKQFKISHRNWCLALDLESGTIDRINLFDNELVQIQKKWDAIVRVANHDPDAVESSEAFVSSITAEILDELDPNSKFERSVLYNEENPWQKLDSTSETL